MDSWNKAMGIPSTTLPPSLLKASRNSPISARKMYSEDEELGGNALTKAGSFMTYEQFSSQFTDKGEDFDSTFFPLKLTSIQKGRIMT